jgi:hypothetical protein
MSTYSTVSPGSNDAGGTSKLYQVLYIQYKPSKCNGLKVYILNMLPPVNWGVWLTLPPDFISDATVSTGLFFVFMIFCNCNESYFNICCSVCSRCR